MLIVMSWLVPRAEVQSLLRLDFVRSGISAQFGADVNVVSEIAVRQLKRLFLAGRI